MQQQTMHKRKIKNSVACAHIIGTLNQQKKRINCSKKIFELRDNGFYDHHR